MQQHEIVHGLTQAHARDVIRSALTSYAERYAQYNPETIWKDPDHAQLAFKVAGKRLEGELTIEPEKYLLSLDVPLLMRPFRNRALGLIDAEVEKWLAKARAGEL
jgi:hypothetical protein